MSEVSKVGSTKEKDVELSDKVERFLSSSVDYAKKYPVRNDDGAKLIRALLVKSFTNAELANIQDKAGIPTEDQVKYGKKARAQGRLDYSRLTGRDKENDDVLSKEATWQLVRVSDEVVSYAVSFIVRQCQIISWGLKTVPLDDGETTTIPNLTRTCTAQEMWELYLAEKESEMLPFHCIVGCQGPLKPTDKAYKGSAYNLDVEWADMECTWEPLFAISLDDPVSCALFGKENGMLDKKGWKGLQKYVKENGSRKTLPTLRASRGGRNMIGRTTFLELS